MVGSKSMGWMASLRNTAALTVFALSAYGGQSMAHASSLTVSPVRLQIETPQRAQALQVINNGSQNLEAQVRIMRWTQENGEERLVPTDEVVASPAIMKIAPGKPQTVRVIRLQDTPVSNELSYRVLVDELPSKSAASGATGLTVLVRYSIPLFVKSGPQKPNEAPKPVNLNQVQAQVVPGANGQSVLRVKNDGNSHIRISHLSALKSDGSKQSLGGGLLGYVLAGQQMSWPLNLPYPLPANLTLKARFNDDMEARAIPLANAAR